MASREQTLGVKEAVQEIGRLEALHGALERRTAGLTWMIWGLAGTGIFVSYGLVGVIVDVYAAQAEYLFAILWAPWTLMGVLATRALWASAGLVIPVDMKAGRREGWISMVVYLGLIWGGIWLTHSLGIPIVEPAWVLIALGLASGGLAAFGLFSTDRVDRHVGLVAGALLILVGLAGSLAVGGDRAAAYAWFSLLAPVTTAVAYFGGGLYLVSRG